ncbi:MAG TPA: recombination regulator RecX [Burkholderiales bacterium]|nr:recombination regulator RecX [Burkholderiales bacterium]
MPPDKQKPSLRVQALKFLARREYTRVELKARLESEDTDAGELEALLDEFSKRGWISETRVVEQLTHARRARYGSRRIRQELEAKGVPDELISVAMQDLKETDLAAARGVWQRKFGRAPQNANERARQVRFLQSRGFPLDLALRVVREAGEDPDVQD